MRLDLTLAVCVALPPICAPPLAAQAAPDQESASSYLEVFDAVMALEQASVQSVPLRGTVIERDAARFHLDAGTLYFLPAVAGRSIAVAFSGQGRFQFEPPTELERRHLRRFHDGDHVDEAFTDVLFFFADGIHDELPSREAAQPRGPVVRSLLREAFEYMADRDTKWLEPGLMRALLNGERGDYFYAFVKRHRRDPLMFRLSPYEVEEVQLLRRGDGPGPKYAEVVSQFHRAEEYASDTDLATARAPVERIRHYTLETTLDRDAWGNVSFTASATLDLDALTSPGQWMAFVLYGDLELDTAYWDDGTDAAAFKGRENTLVWVRAGPDSPGERLHLAYHGELIDRYGEFFYINSSAAWYPRSLDPLSRATFDITFHSPTSYVLASVGRLVDSTVAGRTVTTRWVSESPIRNASFNLGLFEPHTVQEGDGPVVTVLWSDEAQRALRRVLPQGRGVERAVGEDVSKSLQFFQTMFGRATTDQFYATEIPYGHGEAFPGLVHLSWVTFQGLDDEGGDEIFRAHEAAHQWWGIGVDYASYHDLWLSEGLAHFSGLWYLQTARRDNERYFNALRNWRRELLQQREVALRREYDLAPIWMGDRASSSTAPNDHQLVVYRKGAWVVHMLRLLMLDLSTMNEDAFAAMLRDFYTTYRGRTATTADFRAVVERHTRMPMDWFFDQWVYGSAIPTYHVAHRSERTPDGQYRVTLRVRQEGVPEDFRMWVPVSVDLGGDRWARLRVEVAGPVSEIHLPLMPSEPRGIRFNELEAVLAEVEYERW